ncbi:unknown protein [Spodoptera frugiperda multiple nucleopolyhedrovirus]|uniref:Sf103 n=1 Tax=Spodoptera frugiperda nuclear polyhedrosis virus TaxID=10455 RepID=A1YJ93_NPVSF|nr:hypothetical protein SFMNPV_gp103 [Spodoptera frugiperda multiple nucleopolyhedrovirus]ABM45813.1 unknown protein [Spodoptera frugiperda multiple nucleopolyhedrovirus]ADV91335.1 hypothetical protein Sf103 [Spodoptera frugiperda multiple nucleopolyhedrovirus]AFH59046.1 hypothetical protein Sf103 [Spodoptera frugiperda multiple nucleopolyhedrovirus]AIW01514.1 hypothetical protein [Spodoptera frugiperda multiple nucleopolyhedrovirus]QED40016.1 hypothetical protein [Spodoptera frugiperda multip
MNKRKTTFRTLAKTLHTMLWDRGITRLFSMKKNTNFDRDDHSQHNNDSADRRVDETNQVVYCKNCKFIAPMSISFENYIRLHDEFNKIVFGDCKLVKSPNSLKEPLVFSSSTSIIKCCFDEDKTL